MNKKTKMNAILAASLGLSAPVSAEYIPTSAGSPRAPLSEAPVYQTGETGLKQLVVKLDNLLEAHSLDPAGNYTLNVITGNDLISAYDVSNESAFGNIRYGHPTASNPENTLDSNDSVKLILVSDDTNTAYELSGFKFKQSTDPAYQTGSTFTFGDARNVLVDASKATLSKAYKNIEGVSLEDLAANQNVAPGTFTQNGTTITFPSVYSGTDGNVYIAELQVSTNLKDWNSPTTLTPINENGVLTYDLLESGNNSNFGRISYKKVGDLE